MLIRKSQPSPGAVEPGAGFRCCCGSRGRGDVAWRPCSGVGCRPVPSRPVPLRSAPARWRPRACVGRRRRRGRCRAPGRSPPARRPQRHPRAAPRSGAGGGPRFWGLTGMASAPVLSPNPRLGAVASIHRRHPVARSADPNPGDPRRSPPTPRDVGRGQPGTAAPVLPGLCHPDAPRCYGHVAGTVAWPVGPWHEPRGTVPGVGWG